MNNLHSIVKYWINSLLDAERMNIDLNNYTIDQDFFASKTSEFKDGKINSQQADKIFQKHKAKQLEKSSKSEEQSQNTINVILCPIYIRPQSTSGKPTISLKPLAPLWIPAVMKVTGELYVSQGSPPWISRDLLEPFDRPIFTIGTIENVDEFINKNSLANAQINWHSFWKYSIDMFRYVTGSMIEEFYIDGYRSQVETYILVADNFKGASFHIRRVYENLLRNQKLPKLLSNYLSMQSPSLRNLLSDKEQGDISSKHLGQMNNQLSLSPSQRETLHHFLTLASGDILAVNGPPGTGKTTLIQSVVATIWIDAAIRNIEPPIIVAASTNNQAVTNIIESFESLQGNENGTNNRWLPKVRSYGLYCVSEAKGKSIDPNSDFQYITPNNEVFFKSLLEDSDYLNDASANFLKKCAAYFNQNFQSLTQAKDALHRHLVDVVENIKTGTIAWAELSAAQKEANIAYAKFGGLNNLVSMLPHEIEKIQNQIKQYKILETRWITFASSKPMWMVLLYFLGPVKQQARLRNRAFFRTYNINLNPEISDDGDVEEFFKIQLTSLEKKYLRYQNELLNAQRSKSHLDKLHRGWSEFRGVVLETDDGAAYLDTQLRFKAFNLATHFWEASWLLEMQAGSSNINSHFRSNTEKKWRLYAKPTPCFVSTLFMAPRFFFTQGDQLNEFIDLLIIDEAGQVSPEIAGATFGLAKKALIIGDTKQIQPIWSIPTQIDIGNLHRGGVIEDKSDEAIKTFFDSGKAVSCGSVMIIAQRASYYKKYDERGMFLSEHRRCVPEIIDYCNKLAYKGRLEAKRGSLTNPILPFMGYAHILGFSERYGGSLRNVSEAEAIAQWVKAQRPLLEKRYGISVEKIVGIVTPFTSQAKTIATALKKLGVENLTVGTIHVFQGSERPIIVFSSVYHESKGIFFFDRNINLLNVAVSRARDSFLVFGNMTIFEVPMSDDYTQDLPSNLLARYLFAREENELTDIWFPPRKLTVKATMQHIRTLKDHRQILNECIETAENDLRIVSPYLSRFAIDADNLIPIFVSAVKRGVQVTIYTDHQLNLNENKLEKRVATEARLLLEKSGVSVKIVERIHNKTICVDDRILIEGSFNWLSAIRDENNIYQRHEASIRYEGEGVKAMILNTIRDMDSKVLH